MSRVVNRCEPVTLLLRARGLKQGLWASWGQRVHHAEPGCARLVDKPVNYAILECTSCRLTCAYVIHRLVDKK